MQPIKLNEHTIGTVTSVKDTEELLDLLVVGYGPAGVSLAVGLEEKGWLKPNELGHGKSDPRALFLEAGKQTGWHEQLMFDDAHINHHHFFDLATPLNPRSRFTFANYLFTKGRLFDFGLTKAPPSRREWSDYIQWVGQHFSGHVKFEHRVTKLEPCFDFAKKWQAIRVVCENGAEFLTKRLVLSNGSSPKIPNTFKHLLSPRVFHASSYRTQMDQYLTDQFDGVISVIGGGMSGGEIVLDLHNRYPKSKLISLHRGQGFRMADLSGFSSSLYNPQQVDRFYNLPVSSKQRFLSDISDTNYGGLTDSGLQKLFNLTYLESIGPEKRLKVVPFADIRAAAESGDRTVLKGVDTYTGAPFELETDLVILATGYDTNPMSGLLGQLGESITQDDTGMPAVSRQYAVDIKEKANISIYLSGLCEFSHGINDSHSFNMLATRSQVILDDVAKDHERALV